MTEQAAGGQVGSLIERLRRAEGKRAEARRSTTLLIIGIVAVFVSLLYTTIIAFPNRLPEFTAALNREFGEIAPEAGEQVRNMMNRLYPHYVDTFQRVFERDMDKLQAEAMDHMDQLDSHAQQRWPLIEQGIAELATSTETCLRDELAAFLPQEEAHRLCMAYSEALMVESDTFFKRRFEKHAIIAEDIGVTLAEIAQTEPDIQGPQDMRETLGTMLELAGIELQNDW